MKVTKREAGAYRRKTLLVSLSSVSGGIRLTDDFLKMSELMYQFDFIHTFFSVSWE